MGSAEAGGARRKQGQKPAVVETAEALYEVPSKPAPFGETPKGRGTQGLLVALRCSTRHPRTSRRLKGAPPSPRSINGWTALEYSTCTFIDPS